MVEENNSLVSICLITYNSSKFVFETLESAKAQTYQNIELIVSDDCSTDNTVDICREWIEKNKDRFVRTELIVVEKNTGIAPNCNRAIKASRGEWIKFIAGDDILLPECIDIYINKIKSDYNLVYFANVLTVPNDNYYNEYFSLASKILNNHSYKYQYKYLLKGNIIPAATSFINRALLIEIGGYDERFQFYEDYPLWIKMLRHKLCFKFIDDATIVYRIHDQSISQRNNNNLNKNMFSYSAFKYKLFILVWLQFSSCEIKLTLSSIKYIIKYILSCKS